MHHTSIFFCGEGESEKVNYPDSTSCVPSIVLITGKKKKNSPELYTCGSQCDKGTRLGVNNGRATSCFQCSVARDTSLEGSQPQMQAVITVLEVLTLPNMCFVVLMCKCTYVFLDVCC